MIDINELEPMIVDRLKSLKPDKIILFGSYASGNATKDSDIDLFLFKKLPKDKVRDYKVELRKKVSDIVKMYKIGFDFIVADEKFVRDRKDYFYQKDILENGKVIYE